MAAKQKSPTLEDIISRYGLEKGKLQEECSQIIRLKVAAKLEDWKMVGRYLSMPSEKLKAIDRENDTEDQRRVAMLDTWHKREGEGASCLKLANALYQRGRRDLVERLCEVIQSSVQESSNHGTGAKVSTYHTVSSNGKITSESCESDSHVVRWVETLEGRFDELHHRLVSEVIKERVPVSEFFRKLTKLPIALKNEYASPIQHTCTLPAVKDIDGDSVVTASIFLPLNPLFVFIDYNLLDYIISKFGSTELKKDMALYVEDVQVFMRETTVDDLIDYWPGHEVSDLNYTKLKAKFKDDPMTYTLERLNKFRRTFCSHVRLSEFICCLISFQPSKSFFATWIIPIAVVPELTKAIQQLDKSFFQEEHILLMYVNEKQLYPFDASNRVTRSSEMTEVAGVKDCNQPQVSENTGMDANTYGDLGANIDCHGVLRGSCSLCACDNYDGGSEKRKCTGCGHAPGKHMNLSTSSVRTTHFASFSAVSSTTAATFSSSASQHQSDSADLVSLVYQCQYPGCQRETVFDPNTGAQKSYCQDHIILYAQMQLSSLASYGAFTTSQWSLGNTDSNGSVSSQSDSSDNEQDQSSSSWVQSDAGRQKASNTSQSSANWGGGLANVLSSFLQFRTLQAPSMKMRPQQVDLFPHKRTHSLGVSATQAPARQMTVPLQLISQPTQDPQQVCKLPGYNHPRFTEPGGRMYDFCGKTHTLQYQQQNAPQIPQHLQCATPGCTKQKHSNGQGVYFDYCSRYCRDHGVTSVAAATPNLPLAAYGMCSLPGCQHPKYRDPANGRIHDYCGRTHASEARALGLQPSNPSMIRQANQ